MCPASGGKLKMVSSAIFFAVLFIFIGHFGILSIGIASLVSSGLQGIFLLPMSIRGYRMTANPGIPPSGRGSNDA